MVKVYKPIKWQAELGYRVSATRCAASVHNETGVGFHQCERRGKIERDGNLWCKQHDPEAEKARRQKWNEKYEAERAAQKLKWDHQAWVKEAVEVARQIAQGHNDPMTLAREYIAREPK